MKIIDIEEERTVDSSACRMVWNIICEEDIGVTEEILFDNNVQNSPEDHA